MAANAFRPLELEDPALIGGYRLRGRLGEGGMGVVYLAGDPGAQVAIKTMRTADLHDPEARARFCAEAQCAVNLKCEYTPEVIADGSDAELPYLVTEYVDGPSLSEVIQRDGPLSIFTAMAVAIGVADALAQIHDAGIVHRDIKPGNVLLAESGPRIIDFGIAHPIETTHSVTRTGMVMGSPGWVAPERLTGGRATPASDVFGWGLLIAYACTGHHPFGPGDGTQLTERTLNLHPELTGVPEPLRPLVQAALAKDPTTRPSAAELRTRLLSPRPDTTAALVIADLWDPPDVPVQAAGRERPGPTAVGAPAAVGATALIAAAIALGMLFNDSAGNGSAAQPRPVISTTPGPTVTVTQHPPPASARRTEQPAPQGDPKPSPAAAEATPAPSGRLAAHKAKKNKAKATKVKSKKKK